MDIDTVRAATARVTASGQPYELTDAVIGDVRLRVFRHAPAHLRALYESSLEHANKDFYIYESERYSFGETWRRAACVANALTARGVQFGDRVGIAARNYPEWIFAFMGVTSIGAVAVTLNAWWSGEELAYGIDDSGLKLLFADAERLERVLPLLATRSLQLVAIRADAAAAQPDITSWVDFIANVDDTMPAMPIAADAHATILYTSGSTAHPKGVLATHRSIIHAVMGWECGAVIAAEMAPELVDPEPEFPPSMILTVPLFHVSGLNVQFTSSFRSGRKLVGMYKWDPEEALRIIETERITQFNGVPTMSWEMVQSPNFASFDTRSLKSMGGGGAAMAPEHSREIAKRLKSGVPGTGYGMTETNGLGTSIAGKDLASRPRSCGRPIPPLVDIKVVDEAGNEVPRGETGEIWIRGPMNFAGYWNNPDATAQTLHDGWVISGDIGHMDDQDFVFITDRAKDMVIRGGENIGCQEVEAIIYDHPAVSECAVFGVPDERLGETLATVVMVKPNTKLQPDELRAHVAAHLARFKVPEHIWIRTTQLPRIASGKIYKRGLRAEAIAELQQGNRT
jgi:acyl-CoA synthetase (AMP-forming)/AMP-acid ligase II